MGKKKGKDSIQDFKKQEKRKQQKRNKEGSRKNRENEILLRQNRQYLQEFQDIVNDGGNKPLLIAKLNQINETRLKLGLPPKSLEEMDLKKKTEAKQVQDENSDESEEEMENEDEEHTAEDLSNIAIPPGTPPETEGQIFKSLTQLPLIKCKTTIMSTDIPPPPTISNVHRTDTAKPLSDLPKYIPPVDLPIPTYRPPVNLPVPTYRPAETKIEEALDYELAYKNIQQSLHPVKPSGKPIRPVVREATISQGPVMRDLVKEAAKIVPSKLKAKRQ
ncbi:hypothetical protein HDV01_005140 [Terramyces sp. JEL0728]|nr:hypothetical protein HDV01_005140 [Terramyces sp. JEL0728]